MKKIILVVLAVVLIITVFSTCAFAYSEYHYGTDFDLSYSGWKFYDATSYNHYRLYVEYNPYLTASSHRYTAASTLLVNGTDVGYWSSIYTRSTNNVESFNTGTLKYYFNNQCFSGWAEGPAYYYPVVVNHYGSRDPDESLSYRYVAN